MKKLNFKSLILALTLLTIGTGQMWADPWVKNDVSTGLQGTKTVGDQLNDGSEWWYNYQTNGGWSSGTDIQVLIGTSSSSYSTVDASWYADSGSDKKVHANIGSFTFDKSGIWYAVGKYYASSKTAYTSGSSFTNNSSLSSSMSTSNSPYWKVNPPSVKSFAVSTDGSDILSGSGTSADPYIIAYNGSLVLTLSGSKNKTDANSSLQYNTAGTWNSTTIRTISSITSTTKTSVTVKMRCYNSTASLSGTESSSTIYYKSEASYNVTAASGGHGSVTPTSATMMGTTSGGNITATPSTGYNFGSWAITSGSGYFGASGTATTSTTANTKFRPSAASTVTATFTAKTYTETNNIKDEDGTTSKGTYTATYDATSITINTAPTKSGYHVEGYYISTTFTSANKVANASGALEAYVSGFTDASRHWIKDAKVNLYVHWEEDAANYSLTFGVANSPYNTGSLSVTAGGAAASSGTEYVAGTSIACTATPNTHTRVKGWYSDNSCTSAIGGAGTGNTYNFSLSANTTVYVGFETATTDITLSGNGGSNTSVTATHGSVLPSFSASSRTGYTLNGYFTNSSGGTKIINADGTLVKNVSGYTTNETPAKWDNKDRTMTLHAQWTEKMTTITINVSPAGTGTVTVGGAAFTPGNTTTAGVSTSRTVVATAHKDHTFTSWGTTGNATGTSSTNTYTLKGNGSAGTGSLTANFTQVPCTLWYHTSSATFASKTGQIIMSYDLEENAYYADVASTPSSPYYFRFYHNGATQYSADWNTYPGVYTAVANGSKITCNQDVTKWETKSSIKYVGEEGSKIRIWFNYQNKKTWITASQDNRYVLRGSQDGGGDPNSGMPGWGATTSYFNGLASGNTGTITATLNAATAYKFKVYDMYTPAWKGSNTDGTQAVTDGTLYTLGSGGNFTFTSTIAGTYTFTVDKTSGLKVKVDFPASYQLNYAIGSLAGTDGSISTSPSTASGSYVPSGNSVTLTGPDKKDGYAWKGWFTNAAGTEGQIADVDRVISVTMNADKTLYACYKYADYTITLDVDEAHKGTTAGATTSHTVTYQTIVTNIPNLPSAENYYGFDGYYTGSNGAGVKLINSDGTWIAGVDGYTDEDKKWISTDDNLTLYAYYKKAEITALTFVDAIVAQNVTNGVKVTPTVSPTPIGTTHIDWRVLYNNGNPLTPQPSMTTYNTTGVQFTSMETSGTYLVEAVLRTGSTANAGTKIDSVTASFQVAGTHTVTIQYKDASGNTLQASGSVTARPLAWSDDIEAPDIFGYTFARWDAGDGVTIKNGDSAPVTTSTDATIKIKATYDGRLTAVYNQNAMIYFKNTLGWSSVYVNFYGNSGYWDESNGSGNKAVTNRNKAMTRIGETDVWYYDYGAASITPSKYVSFTEDSQNGDGFGDQNFWKANSSGGENVVYPTRRGNDLADKADDLGFYAKTPMFVPLKTQTPQVLNAVNSGKANYYNDGYWTKYTAGTGYTLEVYHDNDASSCIQSVPFTSADELMPMTAVVDLEASTTYRFQLKRDGDAYYGNSGTMTYSDHGQSTAWDMTTEARRDDKFAMCKLTTNASGDYTFNLSYSGNSGTPVHYCLRMEVDYPIANNDYRLVYSDAVQTKQIKSAIVTKANNSKDTVSFFIRPTSSPALKIQQASVTNAGVITWNDYSTITSSVSGLTKDSVYNICLTMNGSGTISVESVDFYAGNYYIRTNAAGSSKWDNFRSSDHLMTYSEYSERNADYSHYFMTYVENGTNIKFVVANDYAPNISDTLAQATEDAAHVNTDGDIYVAANVRFMWDKKDNSVGRAYLAAAKSDGSKFLVLRANSSTDLMDENGYALINSANSGEAGYNHKAPDNSMQFIDDENWIYETTVKVKPGAYLKLYAHYHDADYYYKGKDNNTFDKDNAIQILGGTGSAEKIHVIYDFKTDRLMSAWMPTGNIDAVREIYADVMFVREHQGDIQQLTFSKGDGETMGAITEIKTAYGVLRFNKWTLNNKSKETGHAVLNPGASRYERDLFYVSFPFRVAMNEVFGFGQYGKHWIIEEYDGAGRAVKGFWADSKSFWNFITDRKGKFFEPNQGYIIALDLDQLGESSSVWDNGVEQVELYFPSYGTMGNITSSTVVHNLPAHTCTINRPTPDGDRTIKDSHWNVMSVPTYVNTSSITFANTDWITEGDGQLGPNFLYTWNMNDNTLTATSGSGYTYHAMHAYMVQYYGNVTWNASVTPASAPAARRVDGYKGEYEFRLELLKGEEKADQTFVKLTDDEHVTTGFEFNYDLSKEFNKNKANIYTMVSTTIDGDISVTQSAANVLPFMPEQTTVVPVGVKTTAAGEYTFSMPDGTDGIGVTLIDNVANTQTNLALGDYTVSLPAGTIDNRFSLSISPIQQAPTGLETIEQQAAGEGARKVMVDGILYIVRDGKIYDARGQRAK